MPSFDEPLKNWFGYNRRERRSTFILLILITAVIGIRFVFPEHEVIFEKIPAEDFSGITDPIPVKQTIARAKVPFVQTAQRLDLNKCDSASLESLPGIGAVLSARIIKYRNLLGGYASVDQLKEVYGLQSETFDLISGRLFADSMDVRKIRINYADFKGLIRMPYFTKEEVNGILKYKELEGSISDINELVTNKLIPPDKTGRLRPYLDFEK